MGHIASDTLGKTLATAPPKGGGAVFLVVGQAPWPPAGAGAVTNGRVFFKMLAGLTTT